jgi:hypothetical protein
VGSNGRQTTGPYARNLIRPGEVTSLSSEGEVQTWKGADGKRPHTKRGTLSEREKAMPRHHLVFEDRTVGSSCEGTGENLPRLVSGR